MVIRIEPFHSLRCSTISMVMISALVSFRLPPSRTNETAEESWIVTTDMNEVPEGAVRDSDVLDTWFSSALYPLVAFGWPKVP